MVGGFVQGFASLACGFFEVRAIELVVGHPNHTHILSLSGAVRSEDAVPECLI